MRWGGGRQRGYGKFLSPAGEERLGSPQSSTRTTVADARPCSLLSVSAADPGNVPSVLIEVDRV